MSTNNNNQYLVNTISNTEKEQVLKYIIGNISLSMLSLFINIISVTLSFISVNNDDNRYSIGDGILPAVLTVIIGCQQGLTNTNNSNNGTLNQYMTELKNNQNIVVTSTNPITPTGSSNNLINTPINTPN